MEKLRILQKIRKAHAQASLSRMLLDAYTKSTILLRVSLWIVTILFFGLAFVDIVWKIEYTKILAPLLAVVFGFLGSFSLESAHQRLISSNKDLVKAYKKDRLFLRYLIFKEQVPREIIGNTTLIDELRKLIQDESIINGPSVFSNNPTSIALVAILAATVGGAASQSVSWDSGVMWWLIVFVLFSLFITSRYGEIFKPSLRRTRELNQFLVWLAIDEQPQIAV